MMAQTMTKQTFGAQVVSKTLDYMNKNQFGQTDADYDFQTKVLMAGTVGKGMMLNKMV